MSCLLLLESVQQTCVLTLQQLHLNHATRELGLVGGALFQQLDFLAVPTNFRT